MDKMIFKKLKKIISIELDVPPKNITFDYEFKNIDSLKKNEIISQIEENYKIKFPDNLKIESISDILNYLERIL